jgi:hypothetical protein
MLQAAATKYMIKSKKAKYKLLFSTQTNNIYKLQILGNKEMQKK